MTTETFFCIPTGEVAIIEREGDRVLSVHLDQIQQIGNYWYFVRKRQPGTEAPQVCEAFGLAGYTLMGERAPEHEATRTYKTEAGFARAIARYQA